MSGSADCWPNSYQSARDPVALPSLALSHPETAKSLEAIATATTTQATMSESNIAKTKIKK